MRNRVCELLRVKKREYFDVRLIRFLNSTKHFLKELNRTQGVAINQQYSFTLAVECVVPQG